MGENFYELWLYARRTAARVRAMHGGSRAVILPEVFSGQTIRLESLRSARSTQRKKNTAPVLSFRKKQDERSLRHPAQNFDSVRTRNTRKISTPQGRDH